MDFQPHMRQETYTNNAVQSNCKQDIFTLKNSNYNILSNEPIGIQFYKITLASRLTTHVVLKINVETPSKYDASYST